ncbi:MULTISPECIES: hypothetical protein [Streptomyces]|uniref:Serine/threonine protein kinase n=1 Tax=Streptomyces lycii TaxID=2654337 RepID=A0ABQ7F938_9ACTN|nr:MULTISPECIES: hypothetical protein [Streptomyces]KAF4405120.1 hypothetical protein GCU69_32285 [Streptomyces lycii]PGH48948.1 hypothetical protein CRI70_20360 [Streptomyces sp. Ru87]
MRGDLPDEETAAALRERLRAADESIGTPAGLWDRVGATAPAAPVRRPSLPRRLPPLVAGAAAVLVALVVLGTWWLARPDRADGPPAGPGPVTVTVHNAEEACRELRTVECSLRLAKDPYAVYAAEGNRAGRVWHGDSMTALCVVADGTLVEDEEGVSSSRWYLVSENGVEGWLPGVRTRNTAEVRTCTAEESRRRGTG